MASVDWTLTTSDLHSRLVQLHGLDQNGVTIETATTQSTIARPTITQLATIGMSKFLSLARNGAITAEPARWAMQMQNGDILAGEPDSLDGETLHWRENLIGPVDVPISSVVSLRRGTGSLGSRPATKATNLDDVVQLNNGDTLHGVVTNLNNKSVSVQRSDGTISAVPIDSIAQVQFASTAAASTATSTPAATTIKAPTPSFRLTLTDGSTLSCPQVLIQPPMIWATVHGVARQLPLETLQAVEQRDGPVTWLSDRAPAEDVQVPMLGPVRPTRFDRSVSGDPLVFGERRFGHGIGVHAYSKVSWPIDAGEQAFRTQFAIDGDSPLADVTARIILDGTVVSETRDVRAGQLSAVIYLDVRGRHTIALEVDDASNDDVQARLNWLEPALLRVVPGAMSTTEADRFLNSGSR